MRETIEKLKKEIASVDKGIWGYTEEQKGYIAGLERAMEIVEDTVFNAIVPGNNYFVIMYHNGDEDMPYVEEMKLYKVSVKKRKSYCFSRNLNANSFNTSNPDLVLASEKGVRERVFFTQEGAKKAISMR